MAGIKRRFGESVLCLRWCKCIKRTVLHHINWKVLPYKFCMPSRFLPFSFSIPFSLYTAVLLFHMKSLSAPMSLSSPESLQKICLQSRKLFTKTANRLTTNNRRNYNSSIRVHQTRGTCRGGPRWPILLLVLGPGLLQVAAAGGVGLDWGSLTVRKSSFDCRGLRMYRKEIHYGDSCICMRGPGAGVMLLLSPASALSPVSPR